MPTVDSTEILKAGTRHLLSRRRGAQARLLLSFATATPSSAGLAAIERENSLRERLEPEWAVVPVSLSFEGGQPELWLEDPGGELLSVGLPWSMEEALPAAMALTRALEAMHSRDLLHLDVRPSNVFYDRCAGKAWLTNFASAVCTREPSAPVCTPAADSARWAYISPEQTGRTGQTVDVRSDLYALGIVLYQMLTGDLPFQAREPMGWVHSHLAQVPVPLGQRRAGLPEILSAIVMKLLSKAPEDRYQSARGLLHDLSQVYEQWSRSGTTSTFGLAAQDRASRLVLTSTLYGREPQQAALRAAAERVMSKKGREVVVLSGPAGIGKSVLGRELFVSLAGDGLLLASAKAERSRRDVPYASLSQALSEVLRTCLGWAESKLARLRHRVREAVGRNGQLLMGLVPELERLLGEQAPAAELPAKETAERFHLTFQRFLEALAGSEQPLALLLDDLQWVDEATLELLEALLESDQTEHLLLVFTWRDEESALPSASRLEGWRARLTQLPLTPLTHDDLTALLIDSMNGSTPRVDELAGLLYEKTGGNPLHSSQFLRSLEDEGWLQFDIDLSSWGWNLGAIRSRNFSDNMVGLMLDRLEALGEGARTALVELALLGSRCSAPQLSLSSGLPERELHQALAEAVAAGLVRYQEGAYAFLHDRLQESSYARLEGSARELAHLRVGRRLSAGLDLSTDDDTVFDVVHHYNLGRHFLDCPDERVRLARLNLKAANRAKGEAAHIVAANCLHAARDLLPKRPWREERDLAFAIELSLAENEYLSGQSSAAEDRLNRLLPHARNGRELADVTCAQIHVFATGSRYEEAVEVALRYLEAQGIGWETRPDEKTVNAEYESLISRLAGREISTILDLELATDPDVLALTDVLALAASPAFFVDKGLFALVVLRMSVLCLEHGNSDGAAYAFSNLCLVLGPQFGNDSAGFEFGCLSVELVDKFGLERFKTRSYVGCAGNVLHWVEPYREGEALLERAFEAAMSVADRTYASYCGFLIVAYQLARGTSLQQVEEKASQAYDFAARAGTSMVLDYLAAQRALVANLQGESSEPGSLHSRHLQEPTYRESLAASPLAPAASWYWVRQLQALVYAGLYAEAVEAAEQAERLGWLSLLFVEDGERYFFSALAYAGRCDDLTGAAREEAVCHTLSYLRHLAQCAEHCPENFGCKVALVSAELARLEDAFDDAAVHYDQSIGSALEHGLDHHAALACELAGRHYWNGGRPILAMAYLRQAREGYHRWGAWGLVRKLEGCYPQLRREVALSPTALGSGPLDLAAVVEASQALSGEIELEGLMESLMRTAVQSAGAARGVLLMESAEGLRVEAQASADGEGVRVTVSSAKLDAESLPESVVMYVSRSCESVILDDASRASSFSGDPYIAHSRCRSLLCIPLGKRGRLSGLLYLENNLATHVFTRDRLAVLTMLASQAAISLDNARLYAKLNREVEERRRAEEELNSRLRFWALRSEISAGFSCVPCYQLDARIDDALATIGDFFSVDTAAICWLPELGEDMSVSHLWSRPGTPMPPRRADASSFQYSLAALRRGQDVQVSSSSLMTDRRECLALEKLGIAAVLRLPVLVDGAAFAFLSLARNSCDRGWTDGEVEKIRLMGEVLGHALGRVRATRDLERTQSALAHVTRVTALGELAASIAHEVNQPLTAIVADAAAGLNWLRHDPPDILAAEESLRAIARDGERGGEVLKRIVALLSRTRTESTRCSVSGLVNAVVPLMRNQLTRDEVWLETVLDDGLPDVECDPVGVQQVLLNLLLNASESCRLVTNEQRRIVVRAGLVGESRVRIEIEDCGVGLSGIDCERLFETFFTTKPGGLGMGLAISRSIIERHGGRLHATEGSHGKGARFHFCLAVV